MWEQPIPQVQIKLWVGAIDARNHMIFKGVYYPFTRVASVAPREGQLEVNALVLYECDQGLTGLIVETLELRSEAVGNEDGIDAAIGKLDLLAGAGGHGLAMDVVAIIAIQDQHVGHTCCGNVGEATGLICEDPAGR